MSPVSWVPDAVRIRIARLRYLLASLSIRRARWIELPRLDPARHRDDDPVVIVFDGRVRFSRRLAKRLAVALSDTQHDMACGPIFRSGIPAQVRAAGYEVGHDGERPFLISLLEGHPLRRSWASQVSVAGRPSGRVFAVRLRRLDELTGGLDERNVVRELRRQGPWLVVWSAAQEMDKGEEKTNDDLTTLTKRRDQGIGEIVEYSPPTPESPGTPAPPPAAVWVGPAPIKDEPGIDTTSLRPRIAIRHAATDWSVAQQWGDHHFAVEFSSAFERRGIGARVVPRHGWSHPFAARELVISLRGLIPIRPVVGRTNVLWIISHPEDLEPSEFHGYDLVAVASSADVSRVASMTSLPVIPLLQATTRRLSREPAESDGSVVFVGNSRGVKRPAVTWAVEQGLQPHVFGTGWEGLLRGGVMVHDPIDPQRAADLYNRAGAVLADHWDDMRKLGYVSNRIFDIAAAGGVVVTDRVEGIEELVPGVHVYDGAESLGETVRGLLERDPSARERGVVEAQRHVLERHTFDSRVDELLTSIDTHVEGGRELVQSLLDANRES